MADNKSDDKLIHESDAWKALSNHVNDINKAHLRDLLSSNNNKLKERNESLTVTFENVHFDATRQRCNEETISKLVDLAVEADIESKIKAMFNGDLINKTENRSVLHVALRAPSTDVLKTPDGVDQIPRVHKVLNQIKDFSAKVRSGEWKGYTGKPLTSVISIGIGGSYLGAEFVYQSLSTDYNASEAAKGRELRFYANIDPLGFERAVRGLNPETTLAIVVSKSFGTRETLMNAELIREWFVSYYNNDTKCLSNHFVAVSANPQKPQDKFNVAKENIFEFWDWVGGRYSVTSAVGILPLSLHFSYDIMSQFLKGANNIDKYFINNLNTKDKLSKNIPVLLGLLGIWNSTFLNYETRALIPYCEALCRLPAHIQQLDMESNGKAVSISNGKFVPYKCGEIDFGEPGTNAQHSFFQLIHQGRVIPVDFIGFSKSQLSLNKNYNKKFLSLFNNNHDELMSNYFAQADALALGKTAQEVKQELIEKKENEDRIKYLTNHKIFPGNRPSTLLLFNGALNAYNTGQILSIYEHRTIVQGFIWDIGSFDQWGVELGKVLGKKVRSSIDQFRNNNTKPNNYNTNTIDVLTRFLNESSKQ